MGAGVAVRTGRLRISPSAAAARRCNPLPLAPKCEVEVDAEGAAGDDGIAHLRSRSCRRDSLLFMASLIPVRTLARAPSGRPQAARRRESSPRRPRRSVAARATVQGCRAGRGRGSDDIYNRSARHEPKERCSRASMAQMPLSCRSAAGGSGGVKEGTERSPPTGNRPSRMASMASSENVMARSWRESSNGGCPALAGVKAAPTVGAVGANSPEASRSWLTMASWGRTLLL